MAGFVSLNPCDASFAVLSNDNLTATAVTFAEMAARATVGQSVGKYYFEATWSVYTGGNAIWALGVYELAATMLPVLPTANTAQLTFGTFITTAFTNCQVEVDGAVVLAAAPAVTSGPLQTGANIAMGFAVDLDNMLFWVRTSRGGGLWNADALADPATGFGGLSLASLTAPLVPFVVMAYVDTAVVNFGSAPFVLPVPSGYVGWSATPGTLGPGVPADLAAVATSTAVALSWTAPAGTPPLSYTLQYRVAGASEWTSVSGISGTTHTVTGLSADTAYEFTLQANFLGGPCGWTGALRQSTQSAVVSYPPGPPTVFLAWSDDRGRSYGNPVGQSLGEIGEYRTSLQWQRLGMARDRVFQIEWSTPTATALQGAWVTAEAADS